MFTRLQKKFSPVFPLYGPLLSSTPLTLTRNLPHPGQILVESIDTQAYQMSPHSIYIMYINFIGSGLLFLYKAKKTGVLLPFMTEKPLSQR